MSNKFIISLVIVTLIVVGAGYIFLNKGEAPPVVENPVNNLSNFDPTFNFTGKNPKASRTNMMSQIISNINESETHEEILETLNNMTQKMNESFGQIPFQTDRINPFTALFEELEGIAKSAIEEGVTVEVLKDNITQRIEEYIAEMGTRIPIPPQ